MLRDELYDAIVDLPVIDVHSHISRDQMAAGSLGQVVFYHMIQYPLRAAGIAEDKLWPGSGFHSGAGPWEQFPAHWASIEHTGFGWALRTILRDLYDFDGPFTPAGLQRLDETFQQRSSADDWGRQIMQRGNIRRILSSKLDVPDLQDGQADPGIRFTIESNPTTGTREHKGFARRLEYLQGHLGREVCNLDDMRQAVESFYERFDWQGKGALVFWISSQADFQPVADSVIDGILADVRAGRDLDIRQVQLLEAAFLRCCCDAIRGVVKIFQICSGVQFLTPGAPHPVARTAPQFASSLGYLFGEYPEIHFNLLNGYELDEPIYCAHCLGYGNVSLASYWWQTFYPSVMHASWQRRLDMVPLSNLCGFFSDGWCIDWVYGRLRMTQRVLSGVLAERIERGFVTASGAMDIARAILFETPKQLFLPDEEIA